MWKCISCNAVSSPGALQKKHIEYRTDGSILRELPVCGICSEKLKAGADIRRIRDEMVVSDVPVHSMLRKVEEPIIPVELEKPKPVKVGRVASVRRNVERVPAVVAPSPKEVATKKYQKKTKS